MAEELWHGLVWYVGSGDNFFGRFLEEEEEEEGAKTGKNVLRNRFIKAIGHTCSHM